MTVDPGPRWKTCSSCGWTIAADEICPHCHEGMCVPPKPELAVDPPPERAKVVGDKLIPEATWQGYLIAVVAYCADCTQLGFKHGKIWCHKREGIVNDLQPACRFFEPAPETLDES